MRASRLINRNVYAERGRTSIRLEPEFWDAINEICRREQLSARELCCAIANLTGNAGGRTSAVRVFVVAYFREASTAEGHLLAGHPPYRWLNDAPQSRTCDRATP